MSVDEKDEQEPFLDAVEDDIGRLEKAPSSYINRHKTCSILLIVNAIFLVLNVSLLIFNGLRSQCESARYCARDEVEEPYCE